MEFPRLIGSMHKKQTAGAGHCLLLMLYRCSLNTIYIQCTDMHFDIRQCKLTSTPFLIMYGSSCDVHDNFYQQPCQSQLCCMDRVCCSFTDLLTLYNPDRCLSALASLIIGTDFALQQTTIDQREQSLVHHSSAHAHATVIIKPMSPYQRSLVRIGTLHYHSVTSPQRRNCRAPD